MVCMYLCKPPNTMPDITLSFHYSGRSNSNIYSNRANKDIRGINIVSTQHNISQLADIL